MKMHKLNFKPARKRSIVLGVSTIAISTIALSIIGLMQLNAWFDSHRLVFHQVVEVKVNPLITIEDRRVKSPVVKQAAKPQEKKEVALIKPAEAAAPDDIKLLAQFVRFRESGSGTAPSGHHIACAGRGMTNEYGYDPQDDFCFPDQQTAEATVEKWFSEHLEKMSLAQALCTYNTGQALTDCQYYQDYLSYTLK